MGFLTQMGALVGAKHAKIEAQRSEEQASYTAAWESRSTSYETATDTAQANFGTNNEENHADNAAVLKAQEAEYLAKIEAIETLIAQDGDTSFDEFDDYLAAENDTMAADVKAADAEVDEKISEAQANWGFEDAADAIGDIQTALEGEEIYQGFGAKEEAAIAPEHFMQPENAEGAEGAEEAGA